MKRTIAVTTAVLVLSVLALACSGSHHSSEPSPLPTVQGTIVGPATWRCTDHCGEWPDRDITLHNGAGTIVAEDLCGLPWSCEYRCHADCSKP